MYLSASEQHALRGIFALLAEDQGEGEIRERIGWALLDLLRADQFASFVWDAAERQLRRAAWRSTWTRPTSIAMPSGTSTTTRSPSSCNRAAAPPA